MKKINVAFACIATMALASCGGSNNSGDGKKDIMEVAKEVQAEVEAADKFTGESFSKEAVEFWAKKQYNLSISDITPDCKYNENPTVKTFYAIKNTLAASYLDDDEFTVEECDAFATKVYNATKSIADNGINIYGWESKDVAEEANIEKTLEKVFESGHTLLADYSWYFIKDGIYMSARVTKSDKKDNHMLKVSLDRGLQKSFNDTMKQAEELLNREDVQEAIKEKFEK